MMISEVKIIPVKPQKGLVALASCVVDEKLFLGSIGVYTRMSGGYRLTFPNKKVGESSMNIYYPITKEYGQELEDAIVAEYEKLVSATVGEDNGEEL